MAAARAEEAINACHCEADDDHPQRDALDEGCDRPKEGDEEAKVDDERRAKEHADQQLSRTGGRGFSGERFRCAGAILKQSRRGAAPPAPT
eukprot:4141616-Prymnesium_polylepis.2